MLDPGTALAVAGMAMDVSKDFLDFFKAWKSCPEDALALRAAILWLSQTFHLVRKTLTNHRGLRSSTDSTYDTIITNVESCKSKVEALKTELNKVQIETRNDIWQNIKNELKRFRYFFSKETISNMLTTIKQCESSLHVTISLLSLGTAANVLDEVRSLSTAIGVVAQARDGYLKDEFQVLKDLLSQQATQSDLSGRLALVLKDNDHKQALAWLVPPERQRASSRFHTTLYRSREFGTGSWFTDGSMFQRWQEKRNTCLWLQGPVGCGKSVLCSTIIHDLQQRCYIHVDDEHEDILIYHYFSHTEDFLQLSEPMLRSCIAQAGFRGSLKTLLVEYCARYNTTFMSEDPSLDELTAFLSTLLKTLSGPEQVKDARPGGIVHPRHIFLVLDALDEVPFGKQRDEVLKFIQSIRDLHQPNIHLLVTSRAGAAEKDIADVLDQASIEPETDLGNHGDDEENTSVQLTNTAPMQLQLMKYVVSAENVKTDIELVVRKELRIHRRLKTLQPQVKERVLDILVRLGQPIFREVALQITKLTSAELSNDTTPEAISKMLGSPANELESSSSSIESVAFRLDELYRQRLDSIPSRLTIMVHNALQWLVHSKRSLSLDEFIDICAFRKDDTGSLTFFETQRRSPKELLAIFAGLVVARSNSFTSQLTHTSDGKVSLAHLSVRDFLTRREAHNNLGHTYNIDPLAAHQSIAECCVRYLMNSNFSEKRHQQYALRNYAWNYWTWHCVRTRPLDSTTSTIEQEMSSRAARIDYFSQSEIDLYLSRMLWALVGIQSLENTNELSTRLALPYFYEEFDIDALPDVENWYHNRLSYVHSTLQDPSHQLRLVELLATDDDSSELRANLEIVGTIHEKSYEVVTYMWNPTRQPAMLRINGMPYGIPSGLAQVLKRLRRSDTRRARSFWIDAVSINQNNLQEKGIMIRRMPEIFRISTSHAIFADTSARESDGDALELVKRIDQIQARSLRSKIERRQDLVDFISKHPVERLLKSLFDRRMWTRIWPLQEMALSKDSTVFYSEHQISINVLERVLLQHEMLEAVLSSVRRPTENDLAKDRTWRSVVEMICTRAEFRQENGVLPLRALYASRYLQCHEPRDRVYGILSLMPDDSISNLTVDYMNPSARVFVELGHLLIERYRNLDLLSLNSHELPQSAYRGPPNNLPSWVSTFTFDKHERWPLVTSGITYPVVHDVFRACGEQDKVRHGFKMGESTNDLFLDGYIVDRILIIYPQLENPTFTSVASQRRTIFSDSRLSFLWMDLLGPGETLTTAYWRTMCANQINLGELIPSTDQQGDQKIVPTDEVQESLWNPEGDPPMALQFSENRRFFVSTEGRLGLAPSTAVEGDYVAICPGGKVPYILRPSEDGKYILIGDSYVHGIMNGEAMREQDPKQIQTLTIS